MAHLILALGTQSGLYHLGATFFVRPFWGLFGVASEVDRIWIPHNHFKTPT